MLKFYFSHSEFHLLILFHALNMQQRTKVSVQLLFCGFAPHLVMFWCLCEIPSLWNHRGIIIDGGWPFTNLIWPILPISQTNILMPVACQNSSFKIVLLNGIPKLGNYCSCGCDKTVGNFDFLMRFWTSVFSSSTPKILVVSKKPSI